MQQKCSAWTQTVSKWFIGACGQLQLAQVVSACDCDRHEAWVDALISSLLITSAREELCFEVPDTLLPTTCVFSTYPN